MVMAVSLDVKNAFNSLLFETLREALRTRVICYADDTLVTARSRTYEEAVRLSTVETSLVVERIHLLGLRISIHKTEALLLHGPRRGRPREASITLFGETIPVKAQMKYLGLVLDGRWNFRTHFARSEAGGYRCRPRAALAKRRRIRLGLQAPVLRNNQEYGPVWRTGLGGSSHRST
ncbi:uncharacterized protein LOC113235330 [Hyposmocoma kahamanoa]|uniref:uncharacterized protein LOC113235330 n=1 Tax=Hyposmocoma kahamanoa TaxID=1477025 RepID=UPI000E6D6F4B|nr:uncharacterized protein LOC113235330 [Hyposmocoma kahamanoa]